MHLWESVRGETVYNEIDWVPYVFAKTSKGNIKTIDGHPVAKRPFQSYRDYYTFCKDNHRIFENKVRPEVQFLAERYHKIPDDELEMPKLLIYHLDIEVHSELGFPNVNKADDPIVLISLKNNITDRTITFGEREYTGGKKGTTYFWCKDEEELLTKFFKYMHKNPADVISGWYIWNFDLPYIINRSKKLFGENSNVHNFMSPIRIVRTWQSKKFNELNIDIAGVTILDYHHLYKWYSPNKLESYTLDFVSNFELGEGKLDYSEYKDLKELYKENWNKYVEYNIVDCLRVDQLEKKLKYIELVQSLSLLTKCPMKYYNSMTILIEGAMLTFFRRNDFCAPYFAGGTQEYFPAAYVKEPQKGMYDWICDLDIASSYPSHIIALNMSVETYIGRIMGIKEEEIIYHTRNRKFPSFDLMKESGFSKFDGNRLDSFNKALKRGLVAIAPCGSVFSTSEPGVIALVEQEIFSKRKEVQKKRKEIRDVMPESERVDQLFSLQHALKIITNAVFGILAVPYSRYFNVNMAEAITSCGKHTIKQGEKFVNEYYGSKNVDGLPDDLVCYIDTDSLFIRLGDYFAAIDKKWDTKTPEEKVKSILTESKTLVNYINDRTYNETQLLDYNSQAKDFKIEFEQEIIARTALFVKKKKYAYWCVDDGGTSVDDIKVTGLEIVRSDSSEAVRTRLKVVMEMIMRRHSDEEITNIINKYKKELQDVLPEEIAANIGVNNIDKYIVNGRSTKGTPWHIKGVANYRMLLKEYNIEDKYEDIYEGLKAKVVYVKKNRFGMETITFQRWPKEFNRDIEIDYQTMIQKFFLKKIGFLLDPMNKNTLLEDGMAEEAVNTFFG